LETRTVGDNVPLKSLLEKIEEELKKKEELRQELQKDMRRATRLSKQAILFVHQERFDDAKKLLKEASERLAKLNEISKDNQELIYTGLVNAAFEEYVEANTLFTLIKEERFIKPEELGVPSISYVLGLSDVIGELRRKTLDSLRKGDIETAENCMQTMEHIYIELTSMDDAYLLVPGLRRKCDVARRVIETTRGDLIVEARRRSLERSIKELEKKIRSKRNVGKKKTQ